MYMDADLAYMTLSDNFEKIIKPELKNEFEEDKNNWFPRNDTDENKAYAKENLDYLNFNMKSMVWLHYVAKLIILEDTKINFQLKGFKVKII